MKAPTPKFFKILRNIGLTMVGIAATVFASPIALPVVVVQVAGYVAVAGGVLGVISQAAKQDKAEEDDEEIEKEKSNKENPK
jgi:uncharacterized membrane protein HdeD (DUF308 family)